ncbi:GCN5-related N-acetyltransferase [Naegleria gruberi]|uniref:GCN5-related N-acetyltransferase n=1 Tax=Naegleria gruberi TaxID=5762 RepID=D2W2U9_NAEGR|nr:GCN5-related N-acetyltransferase [Naegleria gruberi]EFC36577.1 GCN5-related N-acetyltransferase [Naegleria gruberi]|eukprot:XP_002669321.1 GCN5-related N-acetyltransferase [Naegleria gruberi strain NEG-M]
MRTTLNKNAIKHSSATLGVLMKKSSSSCGVFVKKNDLNFGNNNLIDSNISRGLNSNVASLYNAQTKRRNISEELQKPNTVNLEQVHDVIKRNLNTNELDCIFKPKSICVIDDFNPDVHASPVPVPNDSISSTLARNVLWNLMSVSQVKVYAVSKHVERVGNEPKTKRRPHLLGVPMYPSLSELSASKSTEQKKLEIDLAVICCHQVETMFYALEECIKNGVKGCVIIGSVYSKFYEKFSENETKNIEKFKEIVKGSDIRVIGPGMGLITPLVTQSGQYHVGEIYNNFLNITPTNRSSELTRGKIGVVSQSGALATTILDWSLKQGVGLSGFACVGANQTDVNFADMVEHFGNDPNTHAILLYIEDLGNNEHIKRFASAARSVALKKPIIAMKMNTNNRDEDNYLNALFERVGILRVNSIEEMFYMSQLIGKQAITKGNTITVISNSGGAATLAVDAIYQSNITELGAISNKSAKLLQESGIDVEEALLSGKKAIPVNIRNTATPEQYVAALDIVYNDPKTDSVLVMLTPQTRTEPTRTAQFLQRYIVEKTKEGKLSKPIMCCFMGGRDVEAGRSILLSANIPAFAFPEIATKVFQYNYRYSKNLENLYEDPSLLDNDDASQNESSKQKAREYIKSLLEKNPNKEALNEYESQHLLSLYGIGVPQTRIANSAEEAVEAAKHIGYPVVLKLHNSDTTISKLDLGGVLLNLMDEKQVKQGFNSIKQSVEKSNVKFTGVTVQSDCKKIATGKRDSISFELYLGSEVDEKFGPVISFGTGGSLHQIYKDKSYGIPPLTAPLAYQLLRKTKISDALVERFRNKPAIDIEGLKSLLVRFSRMVLDNSDLIKEFEINPLQALATDNEKSFTALDCRLTLHKPKAKKAQNVIRSYERKYVTNVSDDILVRPSKFSDFRKLLSFFTNLSPKTLESSIRESALRSQCSIAFLSLKNQYNKAKNQDAPQPLDPYALSLNTDGDSKEIYQELVQYVSSDFDREVVLFAIDKKSKSIIGMGVYTIMQQSIVSSKKRKAELQLLVGEQAQGKGIGKYLLEQLIHIAKQEGNISQLIAYTHHSNIGVQKLCTRAGFVEQDNSELFEQGVLVSTLDL